VTETKDVQINACIEDSLSSSESALRSCCVRACIAGEAGGCAGGDLHSTAKDQANSPENLAAAVADADTAGHLHVHDNQHLPGAVPLQQTISQVDQAVTKVLADLAQSSSLGMGATCRESVGLLDK